MSTSYLKLIEPHTRCQVYVGTFQIQRVDSSIRVYFFLCCVMEVDTCASRLRGARRTRPLSSSGACPSIESRDRIRSVVSAKWIDAVGASSQARATAARVAHRPQSSPTQRRHPQSSRKKGEFQDRPPDPCADLLCKTNIWAGGLIVVILQSHPTTVMPHVVHGTYWKYYFSFTFT